MPRAPSCRYHRQSRPTNHLQGRASEGNLCIEFCPKDCITLSDDLNLKGYFVAAFDESKGCNACRNCALMCPDACIEVSTA